MTETTQIRWFEMYPRCSRCHSRASGILRGAKNESYGPHCTKCANIRLKQSETFRKLMEQKND